MPKSITYISETDILNLQRKVRDFEESSSGNYITDFIPLVYDGYGYIQGIVCQSFSGED